MDVFTQRTGIECEFKLSHSELNITDSQESAVFRVIQESLNNVAKHAHATRVEVCIERDVACLNVSVRDDGWVSRLKILENSIPSVWSGCVNGHPCWADRRT